MTQYVRNVKDARGVVTLSLNRPDKHNALNADLIAELTAELTALATDEDCRVIVLTGEGSSFSSGADLLWMQVAVSYSETQNRQDAQHLADLMACLYHINKPTLARVNGAAYGGGLGLLACCDIVIASDQAKFAFTEVKLGLVPAVISPYVVAAVGGRQAKRLCMTAERFTAQQALDYGLVHECVAADELDNHVEKNLQALLSAGPEALKACKQLMHQLAPLPTTDDLVQLIARLRVSPEGQAGLNAFLNKTTPPWLE